MNESARGVWTWLILIALIAGVFSATMFAEPLRSRVTHPALKCGATSQLVGCLNDRSGSTVSNMDSTVPASSVTYLELRGGFLHWNHTLPDPAADPVASPNGTRAPPQ